MSSSTASSPVNTRFTAAQMTAPDPVTLTVAGERRRQQVRLVKRDGGTVYWSAAAAYYDTATADGRQRLASTCRIAQVLAAHAGHRAAIASSIAKTPFTGTAKPGDVLTVRLTVAGSPEWRYLALEDPLPAGVEAMQDTTAYPLEKPGSVRWWWGSRVEYRDSRTVFFQESFERGRYEYVYLVKVIVGRARSAPCRRRSRRCMCRACTRPPSRRR